MAEPWRTWIPGVLNTKQMTDLWQGGLIIGKQPLAIGESSFDLCLSGKCYLMVNGSVKPSEAEPYEWFIIKKSLAKQFDPEADGGFKLQAKHTYVFPLQERLDKRLADAGIWGQATAKSSVGRVDVLARLIVDRMSHYESFDPAAVQRGSGDMFLEITPMTFPVRVKEGIPLSQLRLFYGYPGHAEITGEQLCATVLSGSDRRDGSLSVDLANADVAGQQAAAFCAVPAPDSDPIPLWDQEENSKPRPEKYWKRLRTENDERRIKVEENRFYLLRSKERISVPPGVAVYCRASDETIGEMRIHYAGFAHPWFGWDRPTKEPGTPLMFEVRGHDVPVSLAHGEKMARLQFYRMSLDCERPQKSAYNDQILQLSNFFGQWK